MDSAVTVSDLQEKWPGGSANEFVWYPIAPPPNSVTFTGSNLASIMTASNIHVGNRG